MSSQESTFSIILRAVDRLTAPARGMSAAMDHLAARTGRLGRLGKAFADTTGISAFVGRVQWAGHHLDALGAKGWAATRSLAKGLMAGAVGGGILSAAIAGAISRGSDLVDMSEQLGMSTDALQALRGAGAKEGIANDQLDTFLEKFSVSVSEARMGQGEGLKVFDALGINISDARGRLRPLEELVTETMNRIRQRVEDPQHRINILRMLGGRGGGKMARLLGEDLDLAALIASGKKGGTNQDRDLLREQDALDKAAYVLGSRMKGFWAIISSPLLPGLTRLTHQITDWMGANNQLVKGEVARWTSRLGQTVDGLTGSLGWLTRGLRGGLPDMGLWIDRLGGWAVAGRVLAVVLSITLAGAVAHLTKKMALFGLVMLKNPLTWLLLALGGLILVINNWGQVSQWALAYWRRWWPAITVGAGLIMYALVPAISAATIAFAAWAAVLWANPITWVVAVILGLVAAGVALYVYWDDLAAWWRGMWPEWGNAVLAGMGLLLGPMGWLLSLGDLLINNWEPFKQWWSGLWEAVVAGWKADTLWGAGEALITGLWGGLKSVWTRVETWMAQKVGKLTDWMPAWLKARLGMTDSAWRVADNPPGEAPSSPLANPASALMQNPALALARPAAPALGATSEFQGTLRIDVNAPAGARIREQEYRGADALDVITETHAGPTLAWGSLP